MKKHINKFAVLLLSFVIVGCANTSSTQVTTTCEVQQPSFIETVTIISKGDVVQSETFHLEGSLQRVQSVYEGISDYEKSKGISVSMKENGVSALLSVGVDYKQVDIQDLAKAALFTGAHSVESGNYVSLENYMAALAQKGYVCNTQN